MGREAVLRARRWWPAWLTLHLVVLGFGLVSQLDLVTEPCDGCPSVFRLSESQRSALERSGGTVDQFRLLVALVVLAFAVGIYWLAGSWSHDPGRRRFQSRWVDIARRPAFGDKSPG